MTPLQLISYIAVNALHSEEARVGQRHQFIILWSSDDRNAGWIAHPATLIGFIEISGSNTLLYYYTNYLFVLNHLGSLTTANMLLEPPIVRYDYSVLDAPGSIETIRSGQRIPP